ncbi:MAG TPA: hypothetical protein VLF66_17520 [Thermoanaerobaculia bacterium]|nr:hypothetical protein [Thermoanaerobaculia bacterium]
MPPQITPGRELSVSPPESPCPAEVRLELFASDEERSAVDVIYRIVRDDVRIAFQEPGGPSPVHRKSGVALSGLAQRVSAVATLVNTGATVFPVPVSIRASLVAAGAPNDSDPLDSSTTTFFALGGDGG